MYKHPFAKGDKMTNEEKDTALEKNKNNPAELVYLALVNGERWIEAEPIIMAVPHFAYVYSLYIMRGRWLKAEPTIMVSAYWAYKYATLVLRGRWLDAEPTIATNDLWWFLYRQHFGLTTE